MPVRVRIITVICILAVITITFTILYAHRRNVLSDLNEQYLNALSYHQYLENKESGLQETLAIMGTDAFIENVARTKYGYMKSDDIRFVITNPEVLYGTEELP